MKTIVSLAITLTSLIGKVDAQDVFKNDLLSDKEKSIVAIAAFTANGDLNNLSKSLNEGLNAGLTVNEIKEVLVQLYAYAGFPRSLNALNTFILVLKERKEKGLNDAQGKLPNALPMDKSRLQFGTDIQTRLVGTPVKGEVYEFAPAIDQFLKEHLFGDIFGRDNLDFKTREIATISALASMQGTEHQLRSHFNVGMHNGLTQGQLANIVSVIQLKVGIKEGNTANAVLLLVLNNGGQSGNEVVNKRGDAGVKITNNNFKGNVWLKQLVDNDSTSYTQVGNVTFDPGARTNWHYHPAGQILIVTSGTGYYQEKGSAKRILRKGDVVKCPPNTPHWHGGSKDDEFIQMAITSTLKGPTVWLGPVTGEEYNSNGKN